MSRPVTWREHRGTGMHGAGQFEVYTIANAAGSEGGQEYVINAFDSSSVYQSTASGMEVSWLIKQNIVSFPSVSFTYCGLYSYNNIAHVSVSRQEVQLGVRGCFNSAISSK